MEVKQQERREIYFLIVLHGLLNHGGTNKGQQGVVDEAIKISELAIRAFDEAK